ncbi:MAG: hypothetical protein BroJett024_15150 [Alphaproteobacteria bacterium]|nr:MAG: hypothetical protein BroJett024_15150 [Alphaproteobacteria bacterium]
MLRESAIRGSSAEPLDELSSLNELHLALAPINRTLDRLARIKRRYGFDIDDIIIIAACGAINFAGARHDMPFAQPANVSSIAEYIRTPRETVRRKLQVIESRGFLQRYSGGYLITSTREWLSLMDILVPKRAT